MRGFDHETILSPSFHGLSKNAWHNDPPFVYKIRRKTLGSTWKIGWGTTKNWVGVCGTLPETLTLFQNKSCDFPYPISNLKPWSPAHDRSAWQAVMARTGKVGVNIKRVMVLSPNDELLLKNIPNSHALFETKTAQNPYPLAPHIPI